MDPLNQIRHIIAMLLESTLAIDKPGVGLTSIYSLDLLSLRQGWYIVLIGQLVNTAIVSSKYNID